MAKVKIGLDSVYYSILNSDTTAGISYQAPVKLAGAITMNINTNSDVSTLFADDGPFDTAETIGEIEVEMNLADITQANYAILMGHTTSAGVMQESSTDQPINIALGFRAKRSNDGYSYIWLLKGKFSKPTMDHETKTDSISWQTPTFTGKFTARVYDGLYKYSTRTDATDYTSTIGSTWFDSVYGTTADTTAPTYSSSVPSAGSTSATQTTNITITFSEAILSSTVTAANFSILQATSSTTITIDSFSISTGAETITLTQSTFTASTTYDVIMTTGIKDTAGNGLSGDATFRFTTSA